MKIFALIWVIVVFFMMASGATPNVSDLAAGIVIAGIISGVATPVLLLWVRMMRWLSK